MNRQYTTKIMVRIDDTWRVANAVENTYDLNSGNICAELNGLVILVNGGQWFNISPSISDEQVRLNTIQSNIDALFATALRKADQKRREGRLASRERLRMEQAAVLLNAQAVNLPAAVPPVQQPVPVINRVEDNVNVYYDEYDFDELD